MGITRAKQCPCREGPGFIYLRRQRKGPISDMIVDEVFYHEMKF